MPNVGADIRNGLLKPPDQHNRQTDYQRGVILWQNTENAVTVIGPLRPIPSILTKTGSPTGKIMKQDELIEIITNGENSGIEFKLDDIRPEQLAKEAVALQFGGHRH